MKPVILLCRMGSQKAAELASNPWLSEEYDFITLDQQPLDSYEQYRHLFVACYEDRPYFADKERTARQLDMLFKGWKPRYTVVTQPLMWYSNIVSDTCTANDCKVIYGESAFDGQWILDKIGIQYSEYNEIQSYSDNWCREDWKPPKVTRQGQPDPLPTESIRQRYEQHTDARPVVAVFGQCPTDMSLVMYPEIHYYEWLHDLFQNKGIYYIFKHHPLALTEGIERYDNVKVANENVISLLSTYKRCAAYSSSVIYEGVALGCHFMTGGYHLFSGSECCVETDSPGSSVANFLLYNLGNQFDVDKRMSFLQNKYFVNLLSKRCYDKITLSPEEYYSGN